MKKPPNSFWGSSCYKNQTKRGKNTMVKVKENRYQKLVSNYVCIIAHLVSICFTKHQKKIVVWLRLHQDEFLHSIHTLSRSGLFSEFALLVVCCCLMK